MPALAVGLSPHGEVKREPGANPGLSRSGEQERTPSSALVDKTGKRRPVEIPGNRKCLRVRRPADGPRERGEATLRRKEATNMTMNLGPGSRRVDASNLSKERSGLVIVYTGDGKGKTTAALGMVFRALGRGFR